MSMNWPIAFVQLFFTLGWTVYVIFLPGLLKLAGIDLSWLPWILIVDQLLFAAADLATGVWFDRSAEWLRKAANALTVLVLLSCAIFVTLPLMVQSSPAWVFVLALFIWVICSSVLRVPPLAMLAKFATPSQPATLHTPVAAYLFGLGVAGALAPYLTVLLKNRDPMLPFVVASISLAVATLVLRRALVKAGSVSSPPTAPSLPSSPISNIAFAAPLLIAVGLFAAGMQIHAGVNSAKLFTKVAPGVSLEWLMPLFWAGFSVAMFPASVWLTRRAERDANPHAPPANALWLAGVLGGMALVGCAMQPMLPTLIALQIIAGALWAVVLLAAITSATLIGRSGREGGWIGATMALLALATVGRIALALVISPGNNENPGRQIADLLPWISGTAWLLAAGTMVIVVMRRRGDGTDPRVSVTAKRK